MKAEIQNANGWVRPTDPEVLKATFKDMLLDSGFKILGELDYHFAPQGYTALFLLAESHFAIHTFPEENKTYIELSSCNEAKYREFKKKLREHPEMELLS